ncbi:MAG: glycerophosphodiester phosphodiesterase [Chitinophagaceae bacterium]|nr:glycerophosphodiester phosphodiesterase [Chitinophagaceae bacterium]
MQKNIRQLLRLFFMVTGSTTMLYAQQSLVLPAFADLQGHRGCRGLMPENTIPAMIKALELGVHTLEMDAAITADGEVVLSHEPYFNPNISTHPNGKPVTTAEAKSLNLYKMTYAQVRAFDVGMRPHPFFAAQQKMPVCKPLLADVVKAVQEWCSTHQKPLPWFNIETKCSPQTDGEYHPDAETFAEVLYQQVKKSGILHKTIIQSFDFRTLQYLHNKYPEVPLAALVEEKAVADVDENIRLLGFVPAIYSPAHQAVTPQVVQACARAGMRLIPWTVNDTARAAELKAMGVTAVITDYPDRVR